jgi:predicted dehydrogenase
MSESRDCLNVAVVGCGYWGKHYVRITNTLQKTRCAMICDPCQSALDKMKILYPSIPTTATIDEVCANDAIEAVIIVVPATVHFQVAKKCLDAGKHILVEKPFTTTAEDGEKLKAIASEKNLTIVVGHTFMYNSRVTKAHQLVSAGEIGDIRIVYAQRTNLGPIRHDTSVVWDLAPHDISIFLYVLNGLMPNTVSAVGQSVLSTTRHVDVAFITLMYPGNIIGHIHVSWLDPQKVRQVTFVGSKARMSIDDTNNNEPLRIFNKSVDGRKQEESDGTQRDFTFRDGDIFSPLVNDKEPLTQQVLDFVKCTNTRETPVSTADMGIKVTKILEAVDQSISLDGRPIKFS